MSGTQDLEKLRRVAHDAQLREWLEAEKFNAVKSLAVIAEPVLFHRAQGKYELANRLLELLDKAKDLR